MELHSASTPIRPWAIGRPKKACGQCKMQKVRCSGDRPICKRCSKIGHKCMYEVHQTPRIFRRMREKTPSRSSSVQQRSDSSSHTKRTIYEANPQGRISTPLLKSPSMVGSIGIPPALISDLIDVYFANAYNATLLLHKSAFLQALASGTARPHVILSVCAWAANFYRDGHDKATLRDQGYMIEWADRAGKLVFAEAEEPHEDNIVTFMNLALLFYASGIWRRGLLHRGNAVLLVQALGLGYDRPGREDLWDSEVRRRRFWACYLMNAHSSEPASTAITEPSEATMKLTLPWNEEEFETRSSSQPRVSLATGESNGSHFGELVRIMTIWSAVNSVLQAPERTISARVNAVHEMHQRISVWQEKLTTNLYLTPANVPEVPLTLLPNLLLTHMVYHQSLMALHASIVPVFSWIPGDTNWLHARQISAQVAYEHACAVSDLFRSVLSHFRLLSALPSFVAYAAYCSSAIQIPFMWSPEPSVRDKTRENVRVNVRIITTLSQYWKLTALYEIYIRYLYRVHAESPTLLENEPKFLDPTKLTGQSFRAPDTSVTILGFNRILWTKSGAYAATGEEPTELDSSKKPETHSDNQALSGRLVPTKEHVEIFPSQVEAQQPPLSFCDRMATIPNSPATPASQEDPNEQFLASEYSSNLDSFFPFDPDMSGLNSDFFDQLQSGISLGSMEMLPGWNGLEGNEFRHTWF